MTALAAAGIGCEPEQMLVASTGVIGRPLPMNAIAAGIPRPPRCLTPAVNGLDAGRPRHLHDRHAHQGRQPAAEDGRWRSADHRLRQGRGDDRANMATMLGVHAHRRRVAPATPRTVHCGKRSTSTFNCISVEGHTSTNDTVLLLANGASGSSCRAPGRYSPVGDAVVRGLH